MKTLSFFVCTAMLLAGCSGEKQGNNTDKESADSIMQDSIASIPADKEDSVMAQIKVPKAADGVFYDFIASFCQNSRYQRQRILFPLKRTVEGRIYHINKDDWHFSKLHFNSDVYTVFFPNASALSLEKKQDIKKVTVQWFNIDKNHAIYYNFEKSEEQWMLTSMNEHSIDADRDEKFIRFYHMFASSEDFRVNHLAQTIIYDGVDLNNDDEFEAELVKNKKYSASQWDERLIPMLPDKQFSNIDFGQDLAGSSERMVSVETPSSGFTSRLYFHRNGETWALYKVENY